MPDRIIRNEIDGYELSLVPEGKAIFGEDPQFEAELPHYYLGLYCVTNAQYAAFLTAAKPSKSDLGRWIVLDSNCHVVRSGRGYGVDDSERYGDHPVVQVGWHGAEAYCQWAGLRLPSELEWEKGARGTDGSVYPWGNEWDASKCRNSANRGSQTTCRVWEYPEGRSVYGLHNMSGNVWEWCADWYERDAYRRDAGRDLSPPGSGNRLVVRGGSWRFVSPGVFRAAYRYFIDPRWGYYYYHLFGFRCARGL